MDKPIDCVIVPCGHLACCPRCARLVDATGQRRPTCGQDIAMIQRCPICAQDIAKIQRCPICAQDIAMVQQIFNS